MSKFIGVFIITLMASMSAFSRPCDETDKIEDVTGGKVTLGKEITTKLNHVGEAIASAGKLNEPIIGRYVTIHRHMSGDISDFNLSIDTSEENTPALPVKSSMGFYSFSIYFSRSLYDPRPDSSLEISSLRYNLGDHVSLTALTCKD